MYAQSKCKGSRQAMKGWGKKREKEDGDTRREEIQRCRWERRRKEVSSSAEFRAELVQAARHHSTLYNYPSSIQVAFNKQTYKTPGISKSNTLQDLRKLHRPLPPLTLQRQQPPMNLAHPVLFTPRLMTLNR